MEKAKYPNVPPIIGVAMSTGKISYRDLDDMSVEDVYDLIEIETVNAFNRKIENERVAAIKAASGRR